jgi:two-component SAPR family response regulator
MDTTSFSVEPASTVVHLADGCVRVDGAYRSLSRRETQVVMKIACMTRPIPLAELAAAIFENAAPVKNANNNIKVFINRIRRKLGSRAIVRSSLGYRLGINIQSDVATFSHAVLEARAKRVLDDRLYRLVLATLSAVPSPALAQYEWFDVAARRSRHLAQELLLVFSQQATANDDFELAAHLASLATRENPTDEEALGRLGNYSRIRLQIAQHVDAGRVDRGEATELIAFPVA